MDKEIKLYAGHALSKDRFCLAFHALDNENMRSFVLEYDGTRDDKWSETTANRNIMDICEYTPPNKSEGYALMADEGDIYTIADLDIGSYKIPGAGLYSKDAVNKYGACTDIENVGGELFVCGLDRQFYQGTPETEWDFIRHDDFAPESGYKDIYLYGLAAENSENVYFIAEAQSSADARPELEAQIEAAREARDREEYRRLIKIQRSEWKKPQGQIWHWDGDAWESFDMHGRVTPQCIFMERPDKVWIGMSDGTIHCGNAEDGFDEIAEMDATIFSIAKFQDKVIFSAGYALYQAKDIEGTDKNELNPKPLKPKMPGSPVPIKLQPVGDVLFYFDAHLGAYMWDGDKDWTYFSIPKELLPD